MNDVAPKFDGFYVPNSTQVPDTLFDELLSELSGAELKVVLYIIRRTFGFKRQSDRISISQMISGITTKDGRVLDRGTGLARDSVAKAVRTLEEKEIIIKSKTSSAEKGYEANTYYLKIRPLSENRTSPSPKMIHSLVRKSDIQYTVKQYTDNNVNVYKEEEKESGETEGPKTDLRKLPDLEHDKTKIEVIANDIVNQLGDRQSLPFYYLVASKVPEREIYAALSSIKQSNANSPPRVFVNQMKDYAARGANTRSRSLDSVRQGLREKMTLR